jgi:anti-sigma factor RsiW
VTNLTEQQMLDVMSFADGELEGEERERVAKMIDENADAKEMLASLHAIGDGVRSSFDVPKIDLRDQVMRSITPNDLDKARIKRTARTRMVVVSASIVAIAAAVMFYVRDQQTQTTGQNKPAPTDTQTVLASSSPTGVEVDFVDTPTPVSLFYVPAEKTTSGAEGKTTETPASVVVWVDDNGSPTETPQ